MEQVINTVNSVVWGIPVLALILIIGIYLTVASKFAQIRLLPLAIRRFIHSIKKKARMLMVSLGIVHCVLLWRQLSAPVI